LASEAIGLFCSISGSAVADFILKTVMAASPEVET
jgi:hypothetical protein